jgi:hypothetical protein
MHRSDYVESHLRAQPGEQVRKVRRVTSVHRCGRGAELDDVSATGGEVQFSPVHGDRIEPLPKPTKSHPSQQRACAHVHRDHLKPPVRLGRHDDIGDSREAPIDKIDDLGVQDIAREQQLGILQEGRGGVRREANSVDRNAHLPVLASTNEPLRDQVPDTPTVAHAVSVNGRVWNVVQDRQVDDSAHLGTVGANDGQSQLTAEERQLIGAHNPIFNAVSSSRAEPKVPQHN